MKTIGEYREAFLEASHIDFVASSSKVGESYKEDFHRKKDEAKLAYDEAFFNWGYTKRVFTCVECAWQTLAPMNEGWLSAGDNEGWCPACAHLANLKPGESA